MTWDLGNLGVGEAGSVEVTVSLADFGTYDDTGTFTYFSGNTPRDGVTNAVTVEYAADSDGDGATDCADNCPLDPNPPQDLTDDPANCGACGAACLLPHASPACVDGGCAISSCDDGWENCDGAVPNGCEYDELGFAGDEANCGGCGIACAPAHAVAECACGACTVASCDAGWAGCDASPANGCEYDEAGFAADAENCGGCGVECVLPARPRPASPDCARSSSATRTRGT